jgi:hypothetical protein
MSIKAQTRTWTRPANSVTKRKTEHDTCLTCHIATVVQKRRRGKWTGVTGITRAFVA